MAYGSLAQVKCLCALIHAALLVSDKPNSMFKHLAGVSMTESMTLLMNGLLGWEIPCLHPLHACELNRD